jgi:hypothetical protein
MPKVYALAESVQAVAQTIIPIYHPELATARIIYVFVEKASMKNGRPVLGKSKKVTGSLEFLLEADFMIEIALDQWNELTPKQRQALTDHLLERCTGEEKEEDASMVWNIREPDVNEFMSILQRHGAWNDALSGFVSVAQQVNVDSLVDGVMTEAGQEVVAHN